MTAAKYKEVNQETAFLFVITFLLAHKSCLYFVGHAAAIVEEYAAFKTDQVVCYCKLSHSAQTSGMVMGLVSTERVERERVFHPWCFI